MATPFTCTGHRAAIYALAATNDAEHFLSAGGDGWVAEWHLQAPENGRLIASIEGQIFSLLCLPGQNRIIAGDMNGGLHWIDTAQPERTRGIQHHQKGVFDLKISQNWVLSAGGEGMLTRWDAQTGRTVESIHLTHRALRSLSLAPSRREIAIGASDANIYLLDSDTLDIRHTIIGAHTPSVFTVAYSPDERYLLSGGRDAMLRVWDLDAAPPALVSEQPAHWFTINHIAWSPHGRHFATASRDKTVKIWDGATLRLLRVLDPVRDGGHLNSVNRLLWLPQALLSASDDRTIKIWKLDGQLP
ncbi:MAG: WD40 repeat domain-containing protein [Saprospiraceae bacterium]|nr:WD40 repeat domain-containing protein [Saprospiraceae bacterium]MDW8228604.1 WD40 repeat domain-containing protein [Saprospiraceae bacterium]